MTAVPSAADAIGADAPTGADAPAGADAPVAAEAIVVRVGAGRFAADLRNVAEVGRVPRVTRVPGVPPWLAGVANWRGRILPVLDLRSLLGGERVDAASEARIVVLTTDLAGVALLVDRVEGTTTLAEGVADVPAALPAAVGDLVAGQLPRADGPIALLDVDAVMRLRESLPRGRRSA